MGKLCLNCDREISNSDYLIHMDKCGKKRIITASDEC